MMVAATVVVVLSLVMLVVGGALAFSWGGGEGLAAYALLLALSQISWVLCLVGVGLTLFLGTDKVKAGVAAFGIYYAVSLIVGIFILLPYMHLTFSLF